MATFKPRNLPGPQKSGTLKEYKKLITKAMKDERESDTLWQYFSDPTTARSM